LGGKSGMLEHISDNISKTRKGRGKVTMEGLYRNSATLFRTVPYTIAYGLLFPNIGVRNPYPKLQSLLFQEQMKLRSGTVIT